MIVSVIVRLLGVGKGLVKNFAKYTKIYANGLRGVCHQKLMDFAEATVHASTSSINS